MKKIPAMTDMSIKPVEIENVSILPAGVASAPDMPLYPWGLQITLTQQELDKLDLDGDCCPGDMIHMHCLAKVTSVSCNDTIMTSSKTIQLQITNIACESEDEENEGAEEEMEKPSAYKPKNPYKK